jgi:hypothetical protein
MMICTLLILIFFLALYIYVYIVILCVDQLPNRCDMDELDVGQAGQGRGRGGLPCTGHMLCRLLY